MTRAADLPAAERAATELGEGRRTAEEAALGHAKELALANLEVAAEEHDARMREVVEARIAAERAATAASTARADAERVAGELADQLARARARLREARGRRGQRWLRNDEVVSRNHHSQGWYWTESSPSASFPGFRDRTSSFPNHRL